MNKPAKRLSFVSKDNDILLEVGITSLPLKENYVIRKSIELFNDEEPCIIHKTFCMKKLYLEIKDYFDNLLFEGYEHILWCNIPAKISELLDIKSEIHQVNIL